MEVMLHLQKKLSLNVVRLITKSQINFLSSSISGGKENITPIQPLIAEDTTYKRKDVNPNVLSYSALAFVGDSVWETAVRERVVFPQLKWESIPRKKRFSVHHLSQAEAQNEIARRVYNSFELTKNEKMLLKKGRNAAGKGPRHLERSIYAGATWFEVLVGYLFYDNQSRLDELFDFCFDQINEITASNGFKELNNRCRKAKI
jgi:ribonuclease-3 family protein